MSEQKQENAALAKSMAFGENGIQIATLAEAKLLADTFIASGLVPKSFDSAAKIIVAVQAGKEMGFGFWESMTKLHVVNGRIGVEAKAMKAKALSSGKCKSWKEEKIGTVGVPSEGYRIIIERTDGQSGEVTFTMQEAMDAHLTGKDNWKNYRDDMLWNRAVSKCCRRWFDDVIFGYTPDELQEPLPEAAYAPETPKRADRKPVESQEILPDEPPPQDTDQPQAEPQDRRIELPIIEALLDMWLSNHPDLKIADNDEIIEKWAEFCAMALDGDTGDPDNYYEFTEDMHKTFKLDNLTAEKLKKLEEIIAAQGENETLFNGNEEQNGQGTPAPKPAKSRRAKAKKTGSN